MSVVVVFRQPERIVLASDSLVTRGLADSQQLETHVRADGKIRDAGPWKLVICGFAAGPGVSDVAATVARAIESTTTMRDALAAVQRVFVRRLVPSLSAARSYPSFQTVFEAVGGSVMALFVAGRDPDGTLTLGSFGADLNAGKFQMYGGTCPGVMGSGTRPFYHAVGQDLAVSLTNTKARPDWLAQGDAEAARRLVEMQIAATPDRCAGPVHVVEINADGSVRRSRA